MNLLAEKPYRRHGRAGHLAFDVRVKRVLELMEAARPDLVLLQEVDERWRAALSDALRARGYAMITGPCWSSGLAIGLRSERLVPRSTLIEDPAAGLLGVEVLDAVAERAFVAVTLHAPWSKAHDWLPSYRSAFQGSGALVVGGDGNFDGEGNPNRAVIDGELAASASRCDGWTGDLPFTARSVHTDDPVTLDFMAGRGFRRVACAIVPDSVGLLVPHALRATGALDLSRPAIHFSDHAALVVDVEDDPSPG
jgi:endonuclease/exonuclease/phosphatase family metal-dependent hydrolase